MLRQLFGKVLAPKARQWAVQEVRDLLSRNQLAQAREAALNLYPHTPKREWVQACLLAELAFRENRDAEAETGFREVLKHEPGMADAHYGLSLLLLEQGQAEAAVQHAQFAKGVDQNDPRYLAQLGLCHLTLGNYWIAETPLRQAVRRNDADKASWNNLGIVLRAKGEPGDAYFCFERALTIDPGFASARQNMDRLQEELDEVGAAVRRAETPTEDRPVGSTEEAPWHEQWEAARAVMRAGQPAKALGMVEQLTMQWPDDGQLACNLAVMYRESGDAQSSIDVLSAFLTRHPDDAVAMAGMGAAQFAVHAHALAEHWIRKALDRTEPTVRTLTQLAHALHHQEKYAQAVEVFRRIRTEFDDHTCRSQMAASLVMACQFEEAVELYEGLIAEGANDRSLAMGGYATALAHLERFDEAVDQLDKLIAQHPTDPNLRNQRSHVLLLLGRFAPGWDDYAYRGLSYSRNFRVLPLPVWRGEELRGKSIILLAEQGLGDQVMFASCLPDLLALGPSRVIVEAIDRVAPTLARSFPQCEVIGTRQNRDLEWMRELGDVDYFVPLGDLPIHFRRERAAFPGKPYWLADPARVAYWRERLAEAGPGPWVGVSWRGGTQLTRTVLRSMACADLKRLADRAQQHSPVTWINLQYGAVDADIAAAREAGFQVTHWPQAIKDLDEFTALITALDGVATVCNTTVHYAGAIGKPVWVLAPRVPEWRYGLTDPRMPWYKDVTVFRQEVAGEWPSVLDAVGDSLGRHLAGQPRG